MSFTVTKTIAKKKKRQMTGITTLYNVLTSVICFHNKTLTDTPEYLLHPEVMKKVSEIWKTLSEEQMRILREMTEFLNSAPESRYTREETLEKHALLFGERLPDLTHLLHHLVVQQ